MTVRSSFNIQREGFAVGNYSEEITGKHQFQEVRLDPWGWFLKNS